MKFLKENWIKIVILFCLASVAISIIYYYMVFLPTEKHEKQITDRIAEQEREDSLKQKELFSKREGCQKYKKQIENEIEENNDKYSTTVLNGIFFSPVKNTCIYVSVEWQDNGVSLESPEHMIEGMTYRVTDVLSGEVIKAVFIDIKKPHQDNRSQKEMDFYNYVESLTGICYRFCQ
ncbi:MAG: hypothetical protein PHD72_02490 [Patescibacteria group bacterium]|nr:hypothetical protein [Patescibacteria group bacterium]